MWHEVDLNYHPWLFYVLYGSMIGGIIFVLGMDTYFLLGFFRYDAFRKAYVVFLWVFFLWILLTMTHRVFQEEILLYAKKVRIGDDGVEIINLRGKSFLITFDRFINVVDAVDIYGKGFKKTRVCAIIFDQLKGKPLWFRVAFPRRVVQVVLPGDLCGEIWEKWHRYLDEHSPAAAHIATF